LEQTILKQIPHYDRIAESIKAQWLGDGAVTGDKLPTQEELARELGVNRSTIIRALSKLISEGYIRSIQGSGVFIAERRASLAPFKSLGLIVPQLHAPVITQACRGVEQRARELGYRIMLSCSENDIKLEQQLAWQDVKAGVKGIIIYPVTRWANQIETDYLSQWNDDTRIIALDIGLERWGCSLVQFDNFELGRSITQQLLRRGRKNIAFLNWPANYLHNSVHDRRAGWLAAMDEAGRRVPDDYLTWPVDPNDVSNTIPEARYDSDAIADLLLQLKPRPDAVIATRDLIAAHLIQALINQGILVPRDVLVTGFDNDRLVSRLFRPLFPTSRPDFVRLGRLGVDVMNRMITNQEERVRTFYLPVPVLWREPQPGALSQFEPEGGEVTVEA
jgi:DNA-binding LacI/PurR family transcriptional regulator